MVINSGLVHDELSNGPFGLFCIAVSGLRIQGGVSLPLYKIFLPVKHAGQVR